MKITFQIFSLLLLLVPQLSFAAAGDYDWVAEESGEREVQVSKNRNYAGGADEQDLKVQKYLAPPSRSPDAVVLEKRADAEVDDHSPTE